MKLNKMKILLLIIIPLINVYPKQIVIRPEEKQEPQALISLNQIDTVLVTQLEIWGATLTEKQKVNILRALNRIDSQNFAEVDFYAGEAAERAGKYKFYEAIPALENTIWLRRDYTKYEYLEALLAMNAPNTHQLTLAYLDTLNHSIEDSLSVAEYRVDANKILFKLNDFSKVDYIFQMLDMKSYDEYTLRLLPDIVRNVPKYSERAKSILESAVTLAEDHDSRRMALYELEQLYGFGAFPYMKKMYIEDKDTLNRRGVLHYFVKYLNEEANKFLRERYVIETDDNNRFFIELIFLTEYCRVSDYKFLRDYADNETNYEHKDKLNTSLYIFEPPKPDKQMPVTSMLDTLLSYNQQCKTLNWLDEALAAIVNDSVQIAKNYLSDSDSVKCANLISQISKTLRFELRDSLNLTSRFINRDGFNFLYYYSQYILDRLPKGIAVALKNSTGNLLPGGALQYYVGGWKDAVNNNDGTFTIDPPEGEASTTLKTISLRMTYEYGTQTKSNVTVGTDTIVFQTINAQVQLKNSQGVLIDSGSVQFYAGAWRNFGSTVNGIASKELLPLNYSFRMTYAYASKDKQQDLGTNPNVVFQTVAANVQLQSSAGNFIDVGSVQYYSGAWRTFGITTNGVAVKELLPNNYSFRMTYAFASKDKQQDLNLDTIIVFKTVAATVQLKNSSGGFIDEGTVQYYSGAWRNFGSTTDGVAVKELLPNSYSFRMTYAYASKDKQQDLNASPVVIFQTVAANVQLQNSTGSLMPAPMGDEGIVQYYSGAWRVFGPTSNGVAVKELLPNNYTFRMNYAYASKDKQQDIGANNTVVFQTVSANVILQNSSGNLMPDPLGNQGTVQYYSGAWRAFGTTTNGIATKELLPNNYSFRMTYEYASKDKQQDLGINPNVVFQTIAANVQLQNSAGNLIDYGTVQYYSGAWRDFGTTTNGVSIKELLPNSYSFRMTYEYVSNDKSQDVGVNSVVVFPTVLCTIRVKDSQNQPVNDVLASYYSGAWRQIGNTVNGEITKELLPANLSFRIQKQDVQQNLTQNIGTNNLVEFTLP